VSIGFTSSRGKDIGNAFPANFLQVECIWYATLGQTTCIRPPTLPCGGIVPHLSGFRRKSAALCRKGHAVCQTRGGGA
jgi:hypothetical protein